MRRVLIGELGAIVNLGLHDLIGGDNDCQIVAESTAPASVLDELEATKPDVVLLDLDDTETSRELAMAITDTHPSVKVIACSSTEPRMRVFPAFHRGESYVARMSPDLLIAAVKEA